MIIQILNVISFILVITILIHQDKLKPKNKYKNRKKIIIILISIFILIPLILYYIKEFYTIEDIRKTINITYIVLVYIITFIYFSGIYIKRK